MDYFSIGDSILAIGDSILEQMKTIDKDKVVRDLVDKANQNDIQPEKIQLDVQKKNEVIEKIEELCQENIWLWLIFWIRLLGLVANLVLEQ